MKIGDLVRLSAYGKKRKRAGWIDFEDVGLIVRIVEYGNSYYPPEYEVKWMKSVYGPNRAWEWTRLSTRTDLKYAK